ncbi:Addiction module toxin, HicA family [Candidatus Electronema halotolerans]
MSKKWPRLTAQEAEKLLLDKGFELSRQKGSHRVYRKDSCRMVIPHHQGKTLHPKIIRELFDLLLDATK